MLSSTVTRCNFYVDWCLNCVLVDTFFSPFLCHFEFPQLPWSTGCRSSISSAIFCFTSNCFVVVLWQLCRWSCSCYHFFIIIIISIINNNYYYTFKCELIYYALCSNLVLIHSLTFKDAFPNVMSPRTPNYNTGTEGKEW